MVDVDAALDYLGFVTARHEAWQNRQRADPAPWTDEPIVASHKFTNVFRILDHGSQFLVRELLDPNIDQRDTLMRCFLYRHTNRPEAWEAVKLWAGDYPTLRMLPELTKFWQTYRDAGGQVFSGAYMIYPQTHIKGSDKIEQIVNLTRRLFDATSPDTIVPDFLHATTQRDRFGVLRRNRGVADFMSMQILTDWGYSSQCGEDRENEFIVLGPGAKRGAAALGADINWAFRSVYALQDVPTIGDGRRPSLMDIQNTLCEFSKYVRFASKSDRQKAYAPAHPGLQLRPALPSHW